MPIIDYQCFCQAMRARFEVRLCGDDEELLDAVAVAVIEEINRLDGVLSRFDPRSEISRINREAGVRPVRLDHEVFELLERCERSRRLTAGYFDVTASDNAAGGGALPALLLDSGSHTARFTRAGASIDLGGVGKGYALDRGREIMLRFGVTCGLLNGGSSSVLTVGAPPGGKGWPVDVRNPLTPDAKPVARLELADQGFSCSAVRHPGQQRSDVLNPLTGRPLYGDAACVTQAASATDAEIFSTALLAMGRKEAKRFIEQAPCRGLVAGWFEPESGFAW
ncbi:MAG: FAD:protein FMN transferase, partial [Chloracidobacterium sp.]|nr:FAD:protein FMN transferase [Chloracidobacterium sp.]